MLCCAAYIYDIIVVELQSSADVENLISNNIIAGSYTTIGVSFLFKYSIIDIVGRRSESGERESGERRDYLLYKLVDECLGGPTDRTCKRDVCV